MHRDPVWRRYRGIRKGQGGGWQEDKAEVCHQGHDDVGGHKVDLLHEVVLALGVLSCGLGEQADANLHTAAVRRRLQGRSAAPQVQGSLHLTSMPTFTMKFGSASSRSRMPLPAGCLSCVRIWPGKLVVQGNTCRLTRCPTREPECCPGG